MNSPESSLRSLPSVDKVISDERIKQIEAGYSHPLLIELVRGYLEELRQQLKSGAAAPTFDAIIETVIARAAARQRPSLQRVINATGVILHTNLGRAPLSRETIEAMEETSPGYVNLEMDVRSGARGSRQTHIKTLLRDLTGAEDGIAVNNNAAAILLALSALAKGKEVIVSRGQAVEIGGGFRIPEVMRQSGAKLVEVGTTNITYIADYEAAITPRTAALLRVHSSNFRIVGFTQSVTLEELAALGKKHSLMVLDDLGSGCLLDTSRFGLDKEPMVQESIAAGASLSFFSGDKLLGGPQAGIAVGSRPLVERMAKHPLARAIRIDKTRLAGLIATFIHYQKGEALEKLPVWQMIAAELASLRGRAEAWAEAAGGAASVEKGESEIGGGSLPGDTLPTWLFAWKPGGPGASQRVRALSATLRAWEPPVLGRIGKDTLFLDPRTVLQEEDAVVVEALTGTSQDRNDE
ncbi:MAG: L-seryl-tRNA(Sec) selenium transferase [Chloroflexi bacterium]|nr:L-seryl-tRNA(Sec) selenium transferase [Chloroflexota bacterium]